MHNLLNCTCGDKWKAEGHAILRVVTGLAFFYHGYDKVFVKGVENIIPFFDSVGIPAANLFAYLVAYGELLGGIALILGMFTHLVSKINIAIMLGAIGFVHWGATGGWFNGYGADGGYEYQLLLLAASIYLCTTGSGAYSLDAHRTKK